jgi:hypothetical protein
MLKGWHPLYFEERRPRDEREGGQKRSRSEIQRAKNSAGRVRDAMHYERPGLGRIISQSGRHEKWTLVHVEAGAV